MATKSTAPIGAPSTPSYTGPFIIVTALFFIFGFITNLNMALVPHLRSIFSSPEAPLPFALAMLAESAFFLAYFVFSAPTSRLIESIGYKRTMVVSLFIQVIGCLLFVPAAKLVSFPLFLTAVFVVGAGVTALQTSANPYVAILGPEHSAPVRLTLAQALNSLGGSIAPIIAGHFILTDPALMATPAATANTVRGPYIAIAAGLLLLGVAVAFMHLPAISQTQAFRPAKEGDPILSRSIWGYKHTVLGAVGIFLYVGVEVGLASIAFNYFVSQGIHAEGVAHFFAGLGGRDRDFAGLALLVRRAHRPPARLVAADHLQVGFAARYLRHCRHGDGAALHGIERAARNLDPGAVRLLQLDHVPEYLCAGHSRPRTDDQQGIGADHDRGRRRGCRSGADRMGCRQGRHFALVCDSRFLLPVYRVLRPGWFEADAESHGVRRVVGFQ